MSTVEKSKDDIFGKITAIIAGMQPDIAEAARTSIELDLKKLIQAGIDAQKKTQGKATTSIEETAIKAMEQLRKELDEAVNEISKKEKTSTKALADALSDWATAIKLDPKISAGIQLIPELKDQLAKTGEIIKALKSTTKNNRHDITVNAINLIESYIGLAITVLTLVVYIMSIEK